MGSDVILAWQRPRRGVSHPGNNWFPVREEECFCGIDTYDVRPVPGF
jgi:hypothetical protein